MRTLETLNYDALISARDDGLVPRKLLWITVRNRSTGDPQSFGLWDGDSNITLDVISGTTGLSVSRLYQGGVNLVIDEIPRVSDLTIQQVAASFSAIADVCQEIVRTYDPRLAKVEIHDLWLSLASRQPVEVAEIAFLGEVDGSPVSTPGPGGGDSTIMLQVVSDAIAGLTRVNPRRRSFEGQKRRSGDEFGRYANVVGSWQIFWGQKDPNPTGPGAETPSR